MIKDFTRENPIFVRYGQVIDLFFRDGPFADTLDPFAVTLSLHEVVLPELAPVGKRLGEYADPQELEFIQANIQKLRQSLLREQEEMTQEATDDGLDSLPPVSNKLKEFREALARGNEAMMEENPFYELTGLLWRLNTRALQQAFADQLRLNLKGLPRSIKVARSFAQIWKSRREISSFRDKLLEIFGKIASIGKFSLGLILFIGSTLTTAKGVMDLVQMPFFVNLFGDALSGNHHEGVRTGLAITVGLVLSSSILDFKSRLFQGVAESGRVVAGYLLAFRRNPRWVVLAVMLTAASIWTNYDGIVLFISKTEDLTWQWRRVQHQVQESLGDPSHASAERIHSLWDLYAALQHTVTRVTEEMQRLPLDEMSGAASSGVAQKGPRYWGKHFIVHGGYQPGSEDVSHALAPSAMSLKIDTMLRGSGLDLSRPLEQQLLTLLEDYHADLVRTDTAIQARMVALERMMSLQSFSIPALYALFNLESYHVESRVREMVALMEANTGRYVEVAGRMEQLAGAAIALLIQVDQAGGVVRNDYNIHVGVQVPKLEAIEQLKKGSIPGVKRRSLQELKNILLERYGWAAGSALLFIILFVAISMDLSDPIFYSAMVARWGERDRHFLQENINQFKRWEREIMQNIRVFLMRPDIRPSLPNMPCPPMPMVHWTWHLFLESLDAQLKDNATRETWEQFRFWFSELFQASRIRFVRDYNNRLDVSTRVLSHPELFAFRFLNRLYGGLFNPFRVGIDHFDIVYQSVLPSMANAHAELEQEMRNWAQDSTAAPGIHLRSGRTWDILKGRLHGLLYRLFVHSLEHEDTSFPLSRLNWLGNLTLVRLSSDSLHELLSRFEPLLRDLLRHDLSRVQKTLLGPIQDQLQTMPNSEVLSRIIKVGDMEDEFALINDSILVLYGMSQSGQFQLDCMTLNSILESTNVDEVMEMIRLGAVDGDGVRRRIQILERRLQRALATLRGLVDDREEVVMLLTGVRKNLLRPLLTMMGSLRIRDVYEKACGLDQLRHELNILENLALNLWSSEVVASGMEEKHGTNLTMELLRQDAVTGFSLRASAKALETRFEKLKQRMDGLGFVLNFVDRLIGTMLDRIHQSFLLIAQIYLIEGELRDRRTSVAAIDVRLEFLDDHFLFLRAMPSFLEEERKAIWSMAGVDTLTEDATIKQLRHMEKEGFRQVRDLQKIIDFLEGNGEAPLLTRQNMPDPAAFESMAPAVEEQGSSAVPVPWPAPAVDFSTQRAARAQDDPHHPNAGPSV
ncbi:MAG: hypothetical protein HQL73_06750 [Magnetococcales bacterium]|nr:hypothetical protein [Magnetococcales bacterium]